MAAVDVLVASLSLMYSIDRDRYVGEYVPQVMPLLEKHGIEVLAAHFGATAIEGGADSVIMLRAESEEAFRKFYDDPEYADPRALPFSITSDRNMVAAPEFTRPG